MAKQPEPPPRWGYMNPHPTSPPPPRVCEGAKKASPDRDARMVEIRRLALKWHSATADGMDVLAITYLDEIIRLANEARAVVSPPLPGFDDRVQAWAEESGLGAGSDPTVMWQELIEQTGELYEAIAADDRERVARQIGRIEIVTAVVAGQMRISPHHAREIAWRELLWMRDHGMTPQSRGDGSVFPGDEN